MTTSFIRPLGLALVCSSLLLPAASSLAQSQAPAATPPAVQAAPERSVHLVDAIAAVVNTEVITYGELGDRMQMVEQRMKAQGTELPPPEQLQRQLLERMILDLVQVQKAKEIGIRVDDRMLDQALLRIAQQNQLSMPQFREQLQKEGVAYASFREEIRQEILMQRLQEREVDNKIRVTESEIDNFLKASGASAARQEEFNLSQILVRVPENATAEQIAQRRQRAEKALQQLRSGTDFASVAASYSDATEALEGGSLGWRPKDRLPQLFLNAVTDLKPGAHSAILKSANGFHILQLNDRRTAATEGDAAVPAVQQTHARHILIKVNQAVSGPEARRRLVELKQRLDHKAATFEELAKLHSNDFSASKGGDLGWIYPGDTVPEFERVMDELQPDEISEPVESPFGYHLIQVLERKVDDVSQERQRQAARQALRERKKQEATEEWLRQLRDSAYVEYRTSGGESYQ